MKKWWFILVLALVSILAACGDEEAKATEGEKDEKVVLRFGYTSVYSMLGVAKEQGFLDEEFKDDNVEIEYVQFLSGPPLIESIAGGHLDFGQVGAQPAVQALANGIEISVVGVYSSGEQSLGLVVPTDSDITSFDQLKGKKVGVTAGSIGHRLLNEYLKENNLTNSDIEQINLQPADLKLSLDNGDIDAAVLYEPWISTTEYENIGKQIDDAEGLFNDYSYYIAANEFAEKHPEILERLLKVLHKAEEWSKDNPEETIENLHTFFGTEKEILELAVPRKEYDIEITEGVYTSLQETIDDLLESGVIREEVDVNKLINPTYLEKALKEEE
ncbi:MAG TPA: aliphatic sulfonate ABC transporter substrate-binding protein [Ureibacillus sp.]|nr:aliphatic sulfonate ABC transporter substrate-binding protein [Ureibacillus sp.]